MPNGPRIRANNIYGIISDNPLTAASSVFNSNSLPLLPVVQTAHAVIVLDPKRMNGDPEIVVVTVHTAGSIVATILRGQYGTSPREHPQKTAWAHIPIDEDFTEILTSATRPGDPYEGQFIFETDTKVPRYYAGGGWAKTGTLGYVESIGESSQGGIGATAVALNGLVLTINVPAGRRLKVSGQAGFINTGSAGVHKVDIKQDGVTIGASVETWAGTPYITMQPSAITTPTAGSHTYQVFARATAGTATWQYGPGYIGYLLIEDIT